MKKDGKKILFAGIILIAAFAVWTALIQIVGSIMLSAGLFCCYKAVILLYYKEEN